MGYPTKKKHLGNMSFKNVVCSGPSLAPDIPALSPRLLTTHNSNLNVLTTMGAGYVKGDKLTHYSLSHRGNYRINIIQTLVQHIQTLLNMLNS